MKPLIILLALALSSLCSANTLPFDQMIIFGDSLSDNGNVYLALGGVSPAPFPPQYTVGRFTNGPDVTPGTAYQGLWHEQLSAMTGLPVTLPFLAGGSNYAIGGAETGFGVVDNVPGMGLQVTAFLTAQPSAPSALYVLEGGNNDILDAALAPSASAADIAAAEQQAILNLAREVAMLSGAGARDFLLFDVGALDTTPEFRGSPLNGAIAAASQQFRTDLSEAILALEVAYGVEIAAVDLYGLSGQIQSNPAAFGLTNATDSARNTGAANPDTYFYWDELHPTMKATV